MEYDGISSSAVQPGMSVSSSDGVVLGSLREIHAGRFIVDARFRPDYWLQVKDIRQVTPTGVIMSFVALDLPFHEIDEPGDYNPYTGQSDAALPL